MWVMGLFSYSDYWTEIIETTVLGWAKELFSPISLNFFTVDTLMYKDKCRVTPTGG